ncbi:hypothetical protein MAFF211471_48260 (plasmid) [Ralstonia solanacearum]|nr:hypothetical protein MAFF211471_48260 [Ralstonia solanacearum]BCN02301.1 hypothetical protein RPSA_48370 [Ralstonia solanacearum]
MPTTVTITAEEYEALRKEIARTSGELRVVTVERDLLKGKRSFEGVLADCGSAS